MTRRSARRAAAWVAGLALLPAAWAGRLCAEEAEPPPPRHVASEIVRPHLLHAPSADEMQALFPQEALRANVSGRAVIECVVMASTRLDHCRVVSESKPGLGFGAAGLKTTALMRVRPARVNGESVEGGTITVPVVFTVAPPDPERAATFTPPPLTPAERAAAKPPETAPPRAPPPVQTQGALWISLGFGALLLLGMPLSLYLPPLPWPGLRANRRGHA